MASNPRTRLPQITLDADLAALPGLKLLTDYAPSNPEISIAAMNALAEQLRNAEDAEILATNALAAARDAREAAGWKLHDAMLNVKAAVIGQYGPNSNAVQSLGLKKKSDYRRPTRRRSATTLA